MTLKFTYTLNLRFVFILSAQNGQFTNSYLIYRAQNTDKDNKSIQNRHILLDVYKYVPFQCFNVIRFVLGGSFLFYSSRCATLIFNIDSNIAIRRVEKQLNYLPKTTLKMRN